MITGNEPAFADPSRGAQQSLDNQTPLEQPSGLTKREYFAAMAMQGLNAAINTNSSDFAPNDETVKYIAELAVKQADYLIAELNKETK